MKALVVDDEKLIRNVIKQYLEAEDFTVLEAEDGEEAESTAKEEQVDIMVLDIMMPKKDGLTCYKEIKEFKNIPTIILSARGDEYDKLQGFDLGIDDYLTKPFSPKELVARVKAILKRYNSPNDTYTFKDLTVNKTGHCVYIKDKELTLTPKEYELLTYFIDNKDVALSREQLLNKVWGYDFFGDDRTIDTHVKMLRNNLGIYRDLIKTVRGMGYKFEETR